jgi:hypothetical protein
MGRGGLEEGQGMLIGRVVGERRHRLGGFGFLRRDLLGSLAGQLPVICLPASPA